MSEFAPVGDLLDLFVLDSTEVYFGYLDGLAGVPEPGSWASRARWHGWRNGMVDGGHRERDAAQDVLAYRWQAATGFDDGGFWYH